VQEEDQGMSVEECIGVLAEAIRFTLQDCDPPREVQKGIYSGPNLPECLSEALCRVGIEQGGQAMLVRHRPGSWEAQHVNALTSALQYDETPPPIAPEEEGL
jgi:hypothetical protein